MRVQSPGFPYSVALLLIIALCFAAGVNVSMASKPVVPSHAGATGTSGTTGAGSAREDTAEGAAAVTDVPAADEEWGLAGRTASGASVYVDRHSLWRSGDVMGGSMRIVYSRPMELPQGESTTMRSTARFNCAEKTIAMEALVLDLDEAYNKMLTLRPMRHVRPADAFSHEAPGTPGRLAADFACAQQQVAMRAAPPQHVTEGDASPRAASKKAKAGKKTEAGKKAKAVAPKPATPPKTTPAKTVKRTTNP